MTCSAPTIAHSKDVSREYKEAVFASADRELPGHFRACYQSVMRSHPWSTGSSCLRFVVNVDGTVAEVEMSYGRLLPPKLLDCVLTRSAQHRFPPSPVGRFVLLLKASFVSTP